MGEIRGEMTPGRPATERIQEEIRSTEADISATLHEIEGRFTPAHIKAKVKENARRYSLTTLVKVNDAIRSKPVPAALIGAGAAFLLLRKLTGRSKRSKHHAAAEVAAVVNAMPKKVRRHPVETIKTYITFGKMMVAAASAISTYLLREKSARRTYAPALPRDVHALPGARLYPAGMQGSVEEETRTL